MLLVRPRIWVQGMWPAGRVRRRPQQVSCQTEPDHANGQNDEVLEYENLFSEDIL